MIVKRRLVPPDACRFDEGNFLQWMREVTLRLKAAGITHLPLKVLVDRKDTSLSLGYRANQELNERLRRVLA